MSDEKVEAVALLGISCSAQVGETRNIVMQTHIPQEGDATSLLVRMDSSISVIEDIHTLKRYKADLIKHQRDLERLRENISILDSRNPAILEGASTRGMRRLTSEEKQQRVDRENSLVSARRFEDVIRSLTIEIKILEGKLNGIPSSTDRSSCCSDS